MLVLSLGVALIFMDFAAQPGNWQWMWGRSEPRFLASPGEFVDTRVKPSRSASVGHVIQMDSGAVPLEINDQGSLPGIDRAALALVRDNTIHRGVESTSYLNVFDVLQQTETARLEAILKSKTSNEQITFRQMYQQPATYRGELVKIRGIVRQAFRIRPGGNVLAGELALEPVPRMAFVSAVVKISQLFDGANEELVIVPHGLRLAYNEETNVLSLLSTLGTNEKLEIPLDSLPGIVSRYDRDQKALVLQRDEAERLTIPLEGLPGISATYESESQLLTLRHGSDEQLSVALSELPDTTVAYYAKENWLDLKTKSAGRLGLNLDMLAPVESHYDPAQGELKLTGTATKEVYQNLLRRVVYFNQSNDPDRTDREIVFTVNAADGAAWEVTRAKVRPNPVIYELWITPDRDSPILIHSLSLPPKFPFQEAAPASSLSEGATRVELKRLNEPAELIGIFFKLKAYEAQQGTSSTPMILTREIQWFPRTTATLPTRQLPSWPWMVLGLIATVGLSIVFARRVFRQAEEIVPPRRAVHLEDLTASDPPLVESAPLQMEPSGPSEQAASEAKPSEANPSEAKPSEVTAVETTAVDSRAEEAPPASLDEPASPDDSPAT